MSFKLGELYGNLAMFAVGGPETLKVIPIEVVTVAARVYPAVLEELVPAAWHHVGGMRTTG